MSHFQTSDVLTAENMATEKGLCAATLRLNNWWFMQGGAEKMLQCFTSLINTYHVRRFHFFSTVSL